MRPDDLPLQGVRLHREAQCLIFGGSLRREGPPWRKGRVFEMKPEEALVGMSTLTLTLTLIGSGWPWTRAMLLAAAS